MGCTVSRGALFSRRVLIGRVVTGRIECTYEPAMTKHFLHGRTEAIRTVQPHSVNFVKVSAYLV